MLANLQKRFQAKRHIKGLKSKKSLLTAERSLACQKRDGYWVRKIDNYLKIVNQLLEKALLDFKKKQYRLS
jgi:hypothetical protein